jgi:arylsulfatase A-like enzyme
MNVVLLVVDSLRADRLSLYGYHRPTSPFMDALGRAEAWFPNFFTVATPTVPVCTSLLTGQFPLTHGVLMRKGGSDLAPGAPWLPELLQERGYATCAVDNLVTRKSWFARGFDAYLNLRVKGTEYLSAFEFNRGARPWIQANRNRPFFLYMRYGDPHTPYAPPPSYRHLFHPHQPRSGRRTLRELFASPFRNYMLTQCNPGEWPSPAGDGIADEEWCRSQYDAAVRASDDGIRELVDQLGRLGIADNTAIIILGDHGESLGEHGILFDHHGLYECTMRPPLIMRWPGVTAGVGRVEPLTQTPDIPATIVTLLGIPRPAGMEGQCMVPLLEGGGGWRPRPQAVACESTWMFKWAWRKHGHKLIVAREPDLYGRPPVELYDLAADPEEQTDIAATRPEVRDELKGEFESWLAQRLRETGQAMDPVALLGRARRCRIHRRLMRQRLRWMLKLWVPGLAGS